MLVDVDVLLLPCTSVFVYIVYFRFIVLAQYMETENPVLYYLPYADPVSFLSFALPFYLKGNLDFDTCFLTSKSNTFGMAVIK